MKCVNKSVVGFAVFNENDKNTVLSSKMNVLLTTVPLSIKKKNTSNLLSISPQENQ